MTPQTLIQNQIESNHFIGKDQSHLYSITNTMSRDTRLPTMWFVRAAKAQTSLAYAQSDQSLCLSLEYSLTVQLPTKQNFEFLRLKVSYTGSSESTLDKIPHCWKSHVAAHNHKQTDTYKLHDLYETDHMSIVVKILSFGFEVMENSNLQV